MNINDGSAFYAPMDADGHPCGLIKVRTDNAELKFRGNIVGEVENKMNEYWVFMAPGSKQLNVLHPNYLPMSVVFDAYGIGEISSKATYILTMSEQKYNKEKSGLVATVIPETAALYIDNVFIENSTGNGLYQLYLPKGDHVCRIEQKGYRPNVQVIASGKGTQNLNVELESVMAELEVKCKTGTAEILVDGELKGNGSWKGAILAGEHQIEARQQNFETSCHTISIAEKESRTFVVPELKRSMGKINIVTNPSGIEVMVDGKNVGISPCTIDIESGKHYASCKSYGIELTRSEFEVNSGKTETVTLEIKYKEWGWKEAYQLAYNGNPEQILWMAINFNCRGEYEESVFWMERYPQKDFLLKKWESYWREKEAIDEAFYGWSNCDWIRAYSEAGMLEKALELLPFFKHDAENNGHGINEDEDISNIGNGFLKKGDIVKALQCYEKAGETGYEGIGDCYKAKGDKQLAARYYHKCLTLVFYNEREKKRVKNKLRELGY